MDNLKYTHDQITTWIKVADQKALIFGSFNIISILYQTAELKTLKNASIYFYIAYAFLIVFALLAFYFWLMVLYPQLNNDSKKSKIYFLHLANAYGNDIDGGINDCQNINDDDYKRDLASQIIINSKVAKNKYKNIKKFIIFFLLQIIFIIASIITKNL